VHYALVPNNPTTAGLRFPHSGFRLIGQDASGAVYAVVPHGKTAVAGFAAGGFAPAEPGPRGPFSWLQQGFGTIELDGDCSPCRVVVRMILSSFARPRLVEISNAEGTVLFRSRVTDVSAALPVEFNRRTLLHVTASPGAVPIRSVQRQSADPRSVSVSVTNLAVEPARKR
jgi:hypothetical protein